MWGGEGGPVGGGVGEKAGKKGIATDPKKVQP